MPSLTRFAHVLNRYNELDHWIAEYIVSVYHGKLHRGIMTAPLQRWTATILGDKQSAGNGMPSRPLDTRAAATRTQAKLFFSGVGATQGDRTGSSGANDVSHRGYHAV